VIPGDPIPWDKVFRALARRYKWTDEDIWALTLPQVRMYLEDDESPRKRREAPKGESISGVTASLNDRRKARGLEPLLPTRVLGGRPPSIREILERK
jgi:hypothetical protein